MIYYFLSNRSVMGNAAILWLVSASFILCLVEPRIFVTMDRFNIIKLLIGRALTIPINKVSVLEEKHCWYWVFFESNNFRLF
jgi:hypothetical protein